MSVYLLEGARLVKIGTTINIARRIYTIESMSPVPLRLIGYADGDRAMEQLIHFRLHRFRVRGEWFNEELLLFIEAAIAKNVSIEYMLVAFSKWGFTDPDEIPRMLHDQVKYFAIKNSPKAVENQEKEHLNKLHEEEKERKRVERVNRRYDERYNKY